MTLDNLRRRIDRAEQRAGLGPTGLGRLPSVWITTRSSEDRGAQLAALTAAGQYEPDRLLVEWRIVKPHAEGPRP